MSLKKGLVKQAKEEQAEATAQQELKGKYNIEDNVVVVEKANMTKFIIRYGTSFLQLVFRILLLILAFIGLCALIYPTPRQAVFDILKPAIEQLIGNVL